MERCTDEELHRDVGQLLASFPGLQLPAEYQVSCLDSCFQQPTLLQSQLCSRPL